MHNYMARQSRLTKNEVLTRRCRRRHQNHRPCLVSL